MKRGALPGWVALALLATWSAAAQGWSASGAGLAAFTPDAMLVLFFALAPRLDRAGLVRAAALLALARSAVSIDPPAAILAGYLGAAGLYGTLRATLALDGLGARSLCAALLAPGVAGWLAAVHAARTAGESFGGVPGAWPTALATGAATLVAAPLLPRLPFLRHLESKRH